MKVKKMIFSVTETILINIVIYILFFQIQSNQQTYFQLNPHPLFLLIIIMGLRYGNYLGVISAAISSLFYIQVFLSLYGDITLLIKDFQYYKYLILFFGSAVILGYFKDNKDAMIKKLSEEKRLLIRNYKKLREDYRLSEKIQNDLKKQIIRSDESILHLYEISTRLETLDAEEVYTETIGVLSKYLKANKIAIYTYHEESGFLRLKMNIGDPVIKYRTLHVDKSDGLSKLIKEKRVIRWSDVKDDEFPLMAAPIIRENKVLAIVYIEDMDFDRLSEYAFQLFKLIIDWVNRSLERAIYVDELKGSKYMEGTKLLHFDAFLERLKAEERRKQEYGMEYCLLKYKVKGSSINAIDQSIHKLLRTVDIVGYEPKEKTLAILLPATPVEKHFLIDARIQEHLQDDLEIMKESDIKLA